MSVLGSEIGSGFGEPSGTPQSRIPRSTPPGVRYQTAASKPWAYTPPPQAVLGGGRGGVGAEKLLAPVVQTLDNAIHRINHYPADSVIGFPNTYPLDSDLSGG